MDITSTLKKLRSNSKEKLNIEVEMADRKISAIFIVTQSNCIIVYRKDYEYNNSMKQKVYKLKWR